MDHPGTTDATRHRPGRHTLLGAVVVVGLLVGVALHLAGLDRAADLTWAASVALVLAPLAWSVADAMRHGRLGVDIIALLAMVGALLTGEYLAGAVIALMLAGGNALEEYAQGRAGRELGALIERAPKRARILRGGAVVDVAADAVQRDDVVIVRTGEIVPVDGVVIDGPAFLDQSALTGEPLPVHLQAGAEVMSGSANAGSSFELRATHEAEASVYASIVRLVETAISRKAPMVRMADRYSAVFLLVTLVLSAAAWITTGDAIRALAVLVIATPCPLILAPPVALVAGTSRAARRGLIVKGSATIERLGTVEAVLIDKTGTVTVGAPVLNGVVPAAGFDAADVLHLAGSVEQLSVHSLAEAITQAAVAAGPLELPTGVVEQPGHGVSGQVDDRFVRVGSAAFLVEHGIDVPPHDDLDGVAIAHVAVDGRWAGRLELSDVVRDDARELTDRLRALGIRHVVMATGDHDAAAQRIAAQVGITEVHANCSAQDKLDLLGELRARTDGGTVVMVGDGVNDAPTLAAADVGIAMGTAGATAASQAAEAVILAPRVSLVADAIELGRRSRGIALQSVVAGMALSMVGMVVAAIGYLPPVYGALTQEVIDVAVILNALRALRG